MGDTTHPPFLANEAYKSLKSFPVKWRTQTSNGFCAKPRQINLFYSTYLRLYFASDAYSLRFLNLQHAINVIRVVEDLVVNHL